MNKAVFLDRDGTIIEDVGDLNNPIDIKFIPGSIEAIKKLNQAGYKVVVITNQSGVARGLIREDMLQTIDKTVQKTILAGGGQLDAIYYCPHHPQHGHYPYKRVCNCRKPGPGMILKAAKDLKLDLAQSYMIGDKISDVEAGINAGVKPILVLTGQSARFKEKAAEKMVAICQDLNQAVDSILNKQ